MEEGHKIKTVIPDSIGEELELEPGDRVLAVNDQEIEDVFDYRYLINDEYIELTVLKANGEEWILEIEKDADEDLGIDFESSLMDEYHSCTNKCIFCFIDQLPKGMRPTTYFKDDDSRLSFLQGNYITLTNMKDKDLDRIIKYKLSPINVSVHTTNPELRCMMLHNRFAGKIMDQMQKLYDAGTFMNGQIVLCKGINDGEELRRTFLLFPLACQITGKDFIHWNPLHQKTPGRSLILFMAIRKNLWKNTTHISSMPAMNGISLQESPFRRKKITMVMSSWKMV